MWSVRPIRPCNQERLQGRCVNNVYYRNIVYCHLLWIPDVGDAMTEMREGGREEQIQFVRSIFTDWRIQTERQIENSSRGKQGNLLQKTLQGVSAKSHTILSAVNVCVSVVLQCSILKSLGASFYGRSNLLNSPKLQIWISKMYQHLMVKFICSPCGNTNVHNYLIMNCNCDLPNAYFLTENY